MAHGEIDRYNAIQRRINSFHAAGREAPPELYNASHAAFELMSTPTHCRTCGQAAKINHDRQCPHCAASWHDRVQATRSTTSASTAQEIADEITRWLEVTTVYVDGPDMDNTREMITGAAVRCGVLHLRDPIYGWVGAPRTTMQHVHADQEG